MRSRLVVAVTSLVMVLSLPDIASADGPGFSCYVDKTAPGGGDGRSWATAFNEIQDAIDAAKQTPDTVYINIAQGVYTPDRGTRDRTAAFDFTTEDGQVPDIVIVGGLAGLLGAHPDEWDPDAHPTVLSGDLLADDQPGEINRTDNSICIVRATTFAGRLDFIAISISGGHVGVNDGSWGVSAVHLVTGSLQGSGLAWFERSRFVDNHSVYSAGAMYCDFEQLALSRCEISGNSGPIGGIEYLPRWGRLDVHRSTLTSNAGDYAGAIYSTSDYAYIVSSVFAGNSSRQLAAGLQLDSRMWPVVEGCLFVANKGQWAGGAIGARNYFGFLRLNNNTIVGNTSEYGAGVHCAANLTVTGCILWGNAASKGGDAIALNSPGTYQYIDHSVVQGGVGGVYGFFGGIDWSASIDVAPLFLSESGSDGIAATWEDNDYRLTIDSPCVDAGNPSVSLQDRYYDLRITKRAVRIRSDSPFPIDMGAYEFVCHGDFNQDGQVNADDYDRFVTAFEVGTPSADFDRNGFVNGEDFDLYVAAFEAGC